MVGHRRAQEYTPANPRNAQQGNLNKEINVALASPVMAARFSDLGAAVFPGSATQFGIFLADETEKWGKVIKFAGIK